MPKRRQVNCASITSRDHIVQLFHIPRDLLAGIVYHAQSSRDYFINIQNLLICR